MKEGQQPIPSEAFIQAIEAATGESVESLRNTPIDERRRRIEKKFGAPMKVVSSSPQIITREEVDKLVDEALR